MKKYTKQAISFEQQIALLKDKGLIFNKEQQAKVLLSNISYYRLRAYTYPFQDNNDPKHPFIKEVSFEDILDLYNFDNKLRALVFEVVTKIEVALRTQIIYRWSLQYGSHWYSMPELYRNPMFFANSLSSLEKEINRSHETFIKHYFNEYNEPKLPPVWMALEVSSFGLLSKLFANLKRDRTKKATAQYFGLLDVKLLENWMRSFCDIRNICAHHSRLWNRRLATHTYIPKKTKFLFIENKKLYQYKLYPALCAMQYILNIINPKSRLKLKLLELMNTCPLKQEKEMGFPVAWKEEKFWN